MAEYQTITEHQEALKAELIEMLEYYNQLVVEAMY